MHTRFSRRVTLLATALLLPLTIALPQAQRSGQAKPKSEVGKTRVALTFENKTDLPLNINWVDYEGVEAFNKAGVMGPYETRVAGQAQGNNLFKVRIDDSQCDPLKRLFVMDYKVDDQKPVQSLVITAADIKPGVRDAARSHKCQPLE